MANNVINGVKRFLFILFVFIVGCAGVIFSTLYVRTFNEGFFAEFSSLVVGVFVAIIGVSTVCTLVFVELSKEFVYKLFLLATCIITLVLGLLYFLKISGFLNKIGSIQEFREYVASFGGFAIVLFIVLQFLQVVVLPIPAFITVGAGVLLFGPFWGSVYSCIGIILGSIVAFYVGRLLGVRVVKWLIGEESLKKWLRAIKGKDRIVLTFMFIFPFFPDDVLCFIAGITTIKAKFFIGMIFVTRIISVFVSAYSMNNSIIPYNTWWGLLIWGVLFVVIAVVSYLLYKYGDRIERKFFKKKNARK